MSNFNQLSIFDSVFGGQEETTEPRKPAFGLQKQEVVANTCGEETESDEIVEDDDDSDLPDFAAIEQADGQTVVPAGKAAPAPKKEEKKKFEEIDRAWLVCYAGHKLPIHQPKLTLEKIRQMLEKEFPELTKERTEMTFDENKGIVVPVVKGAKKGGAKQC